MGWLEFDQFEIICPNCGAVFMADYTEDGDLSETPMVTTGLSGGNKICPHCHNTITDDDIQEYDYQTNDIICPHCYNLTKFKEGKVDNRCSVCDRIISEEEIQNV